MDVHMHRKIIAWLIAVLMLVSVQAPVTFAAEDSDQPATETEQTKATEPETQPPTEPPTQATQPAEQETQSEAKPESPSQEGDSDEDHDATIKVAFILWGDQKHGDSDVHLFKDKALQKWIEESSVTIDKHGTVEDLVKGVFADKDYKVSFSEDKELISVTRNEEAGGLCLKKGDNGESSGWAFAVNGQRPTAPMAKTELDKGDKVEVFFSDDLNAEFGAMAPMDEESQEGADEEAVTDEEASEEEVLEDELAEVLANLQSGSSEKEIGDAYGNTKDKLTNLAETVNWASDSIWITLALARSGELTEAQAQAYYNNIAADAENAGGATLNKNQSSDNSRAILALTAAGYDPTDVNGYNLLEPLANIAYIRSQGINGPVWALLAFDSKGYEIPEVQLGNDELNQRFQTTRENLVSSLLTGRKSDGGWAYSGNSSDVDMTCMVIQALAPYYKKDFKVTINGKETSVKEAVDEALRWLSAHQNNDGSFSSGGVVTSESASQVIVALTSLGIDPMKDTRFLKNGKGAVDSLMSFYVKGGGFKHVDSNYQWNALASGQGFYALVAYYRGLDGKNSLYDMTDAGDGYKIDPSYNQEEEEEQGGDNPQQEDKPKPKPQKPAGATKGLTKSGGLIKLKGALTKNAKASADLIQKVVERNLPKKAEQYSDEDIKAINEAYKAYLDLSPAERLAVEKDKYWKPFCKITAKLGKLYHYDKDSGIDMRNNKELALPWHILLVIDEKEIATKQANAITTLLGEGSNLFTMYDIYFKDSLSGKKWHPEKIVTVRLPLPAQLEEDPVAIHLTDKNKIEVIKGTIVEEEKSGTDTAMFEIQAIDFSPYGIAGMKGSLQQLMKTPEEEPPSLLPWICVGIGALIALLALVIVRRRMNSREE